MATTQGSWFALRNAKRGASGTDPVLRAKYARYSPSVQMRVEQHGLLPTDAVNVGATPTVSLFTNDVGEYVEHCSVTAVETLVLGYDGGSIGNRKITFAKVKASGGQPVEIPAREQGGRIPGYEMLFTVLEATAGAGLSTSVTVGADT